MSAESRVLSGAGTIFITGAAVSAGAVGGLMIYAEKNCDWEGGCDMSPMALLPFAGALLGGVVGLAISRQIWHDNDDPRNAPISVAPYLRENASGVMLSGGFKPVNR